MVSAFPKLHQKMIECGVSDKELAAVAEISLFLFRLKMAGFLQWKLTEAVRICCFFRVPDVEELFLQLDTNYI